jgi:phospholipid-binding lipoprotein MlaA
MPSPHLKRVIAVTALIACTACASTPSGGRSRDDPWESFNRGVYRFNDTFDRALTKPLAKGYRAVTPNPVRQGIGNMLANLAYPAVIINDLLQGKVGDAVSDSGRFLLNSTIGVAGLFDVATPAGLQEHDEDFDQTLAVWGLPSGPYVMVPFLGPSTVRGIVAGRPVSFWTNATRYLDNSSLEDKLVVLSIIDARASLLAVEDQIEASSDPYIFIRESYLQNREFKIYDGNPPEDDLLEDLSDEDLDELDDF